LRIDSPFNVQESAVKRFKGFAAILCSAMLCAPLYVAAQTVTSFTLVNADTGADIATVTNAGAVAISRTPRINIRANANGVGSVVFTDGRSTRIENTAPYAYKGNSGPTYYPWSPTAGTYLITAKPFKESQGRGIAGAPVTLTLSVTNTPGTERHTFEKTEGPDKNPLKGWNSSWWNVHAEASVGFQYVPWKTFEPENNRFDKKAVEDIIDRDGSKGKHVILRFYCQWFGDEKNPDELACPAWLFSQQGVRLLEGVSTDTAKGQRKTLVDFNDPNFLRESKDLIGALASAYDNDPRIYAIEFGILGYWGEWHTWDFAIGGQGVSLSNEVRQGIANEFKVKFVNKRLMGRYPTDDVLKALGGIGFHNDYFKANDGHSDSFDIAVNSAAKWKEGPIGGETPPMSDADGAALYNSAKGLNLITAGHYSTMAPGAHRRNPGELNYKDYMRMHRRMGYVFQLSDGAFPTTVARGTALPVELNGKNVGVAPFYYDWEVEIALLNQSNVPVVMAKAPTKLSSIQPDAAFQFAATLMPGTTLAEGSYRLAVRLIQPGASANKPERWKLDASNAAVQFANRLEWVQPTWNDQNALVGGWSILRSVSVTR
jgi:Domain of unknown function (DUF4832)/Beta-galactosidase